MAQIITETSANLRETGGNMSKKLFLKDEVMMEPLFNGWYARPLLIPPLTASMVVNNLHLRIMESYLKAPDLHAAAAKNPAMRGGPFMDYRGALTPVEHLVENTKTKLAFAIEITAAVNSLTDMLLDSAKGFSLEELYERIPSPLKGYVELGYDLNNNPSFRVLEGMVYRSDYYQEDLQSLSFALLNGDDRPFVLSTPRLSTRDNVHASVPFHSKEIDNLFAMRERGGSEDFVDAFMETYIADDEDRNLFRSFFTESAPARKPDRNYTGEGVRIRYFGHATILIETADVTILTDPVVSYTIKGGLERFSYADLPERIDYVLITHAHQDHVMFETLLQIRHKTGAIVVPRNGGGSLQDPSLKLMLKMLGFDSVVELDELESLSVPGGEILGLPFFGEHGDLHIRSKLAFHVHLLDMGMLFAADSNNLEPKLYEHLRKTIGDISRIFIGMECEGAPMSWLYGPLFTKKLDRQMDQSRRLNGSNYKRALDLVSNFNPDAVYVYAMGQEPWLTYISSISYTDESIPMVDSGKLVQTCRDRGIESERLYGRKVLELA